MNTLRNRNYVGRNIIRFRHRNNWTQETLVAKMQLLGCWMTRDIIANIESCRCPATQKEIMFFAEVFGIKADVFYKYGGAQSRREAMSGYMSMSFSCDQPKLRP